MNWSRLFTISRVVLVCLSTAAAGCGSVARSTPTRSSTVKPARPAEARAGAPRPRLLALGQPVRLRRVTVMGISGTVELRVEDPNAAVSAGLFVTLGRFVPREPRDVCFGTYAANESPEDGDVGCQVRGSEPLVLALGEQYIPGPRRVRPLPVLYGQAGAGVATVALIGPDGARRTLPLSAHRVFLAAFSRAAHGEFRLSLHFANGRTLQHAFELPVHPGELGAWPRLRRRGAVFNYGIGEDIVSKPLNQIIKQFGPPLRSYPRPHGVRCIYYDVVGYDTGWTFCFKGQAMTAAAGNQRAAGGGR